MFVKTYTPCTYTSSHYPQVGNITLPVWFSNCAATFLILCCSTPLGMYFRKVRAISYPISLKIMGCKFYVYVVPFLLYVDVTSLQKIQHSKHIYARKLSVSGRAY